MTQKFLVYESMINEWQFKEEAGEIASIPLLYESFQPDWILGKLFEEAFTEETSKNAYEVLVTKTVVVHTGYLDKSGCWVTTSCTPHSALSFFSAWWRKEGTGRERIE